ncbi:MAG: NB-ARC domain-containing protein, partial [Chloroflexota bacterium]
MSIFDDLLAALERLRSGAASDSDRATLRTARLAGQIVVVGNRNVVAGRDIRDSTITIGDIIIRGETAEAMAAALEQFFPTRLHTLRPPPANFTGRQQELDDLAEHATPTSVHISGSSDGISRGVGGIRGTGGVGKTALALVLAHRLAADYPDAALDINLRASDGADDSPRDAQVRIIHAFLPAAHIPDNDDELADLYRSTLNGKRGLLLLDDVLNGSQVRSLMPPTTWALLVTSRQRFDVDGLYDVNLDVLPSDDARVLLQKIVPDLSDDHADQIAELCGWLPLALTLAGSALKRRRGLTPREYIERLEAEDVRIQRLDRSLRHNPQARGLEATFEVSYGYLAPEVQALWCELGAFAGSFDALAAAAVWNQLPQDDDVTEAAYRAAVGDARDTLIELDEYSLLEADQDGRYRMHDLVRLFADRHRTDPGRDAAARRHAHHFLAVLSFAEELFLQGNDAAVTGLAIVDREWPNILAGQAWAATHAASDDDAARMTIAYATVAPNILNLRLHPRDWIDVLQAGRDAASRVSDRATEGVLLGNLGSAYADLGDPRRAIELYEQQLVIVREIGDRRGEGAALGNLGSAYADLGDPRRAI